MLRRLRDAGLGPIPELHAVRAVGLDEWAWRRGVRYGTIVVDLEHRRVLDLPPDREPETVAAWLRRHANIAVVSRNRSALYAEAARRGAPQAIQVADRFHLVKNLGDAVKRALSCHATVLREVAHAVAAVAAPGPDVPPSLGANADGVPEPLTTAAASSASRARRLARYAQVVALRQQGATLEEIATALEMGVATVHRWVHSDGFPERAKHRRRADRVAGQIRRHWAAGHRNASALWRALQAEGFTGTKRMIQR